MFLDAIKKYTGWSFFNFKTNINIAVRKTDCNILQNFLSHFQQLTLKNVYWKNYCSLSSTKWTCRLLNQIQLCIHPGRRVLIHRQRTNERGERILVFPTWSITSSKTVIANYPSTSDPKKINKRPILFQLRIYSK